MDDDTPSDEACPDNLKFKHQLIKQRAYHAAHRGATMSSGLGPNTFACESGCVRKLGGQGLCDEGSLKCDLLVRDGRGGAAYHPEM